MNFLMTIHVLFKTEFFPTKINCFNCHPGKLEDFKVSNWYLRPRSALQPGHWSESRRVLSVLES